MQLCVLEKHFLPSEKRWRQTSSKTNDSYVEMQQCDREYSIVTVHPARELDLMAFQAKRIARVRRMRLYVVNVVCEAIRR